VGEELLWKAGAHVLDCKRRTHLMGILNVTPDSFSDGGAFFDAESAVARGIEMAADGADLIDVGGESTRPGSDPVPVEEELRRVLPVVKRLTAELDLPISIDTRKPEVAGAALGAGATVVNDVSAGRERGMFRVVAESGAGMILMHMRGEPKTMQEQPDYVDVVREVREFLARRVEEATAAGVELSRLCVDPGIGFGKTAEQSLLLMKEIDALLELGRPILVGPSRKSFIGLVLGTEVDERLEGTAGAVAYLVTRGAHIVRVHDVKEMARVVRVVDAIVEAKPA
jgi:dihydropteroate synthase